MKKYLYQLIEMLNKEVSALKEQLAVYKDARKINIIADDSVPKGMVYLVEGTSLMFGDIININCQYWEVTSFDRNKQEMILRVREDL